MKKNNIKSHKKPCIHKLNIPQNAKGYPVIKRVAFHRKVSKHT